MTALLRLALDVARLSAAETRSTWAAVSGLLLAALALGLAGAACLLVALGIWLGRRIDPALAALVLAGLAFGLAGLVLLAARARARRRHRALDRLAEDPALRQALAEFGLDRPDGPGRQVWLPLAAVVLGVFLASRKR
jgi:hypothetical protein